MKWIDINDAIEGKWYVLLINADVSHKEPYVRTGRTYLCINGQFWYNNHQSVMTQVTESILKCCQLPEYSFTRTEKLSGIELIAQERQEQIEKHGYTLEKDKGHEGSYDISLINVARYCLDPTHSDHLYPKFWTEEYKHLLRQKNWKDRWTIAAALIAAAIDVRQSNE